MQHNNIIEVQQLINRYFNALDRRDCGTLLGCLAEDVDWRMRGNRIGHSEVAQALAERPENFSVRHLVTNLHVDGPSAFFLLVVIGVFTRKGQTAPYHLHESDNVHGPVIADVSARIVHTAEGLKIKQLIGSVIFHKAGQI